MLSVPSTRESLPPRPPSGLIRPPAAVGPVDEDHDAGTFTKPAYSSGGGSEFLTGLPKSSSAGYGGWNPEGYYGGGALPPSSTNSPRGSGYWSGGGTPAVPSGGWAVAEVGFDVPMAINSQAKRSGASRGSMPSQSRGQREDLIAELTTLDRGPRGSFPNSEAPTELMEVPPSGELRSIPPPEGLFSSSKGRNPWASGSCAWQQASFQPTSVSRRNEPVLPSIAPPAGAFDHSQGHADAPFGSPAYNASRQISSGAPTEAGGIGVPVPVVARSVAGLAGIGIPGARMVPGTGVDMVGAPMMKMQGPADLFSILDRNHDGVISRAEFESALAPAGPQRRNVQDARYLPGMPVENIMDLRPPATSYGAAPFGSPNYVPPATEWGTPPNTGDMPLIAGAPAPVNVDMRPTMPLPPVQEVVAPFQPPLPPAPLPPASQDDGERRPHILEVQMDEVQVSRSALKTLEMHNSDLAYFVSLHPVSERLDAVRLPLEAPRQKVEGQHLVTKPLPAKHVHQDPGVEKTDTFFCARYEERSELRMEQLELHLVAYLWANKGGGYFSAGETTLLGRGALPLRDFNLQRRPTKWGIFNVANGDKVAELHMTYGVCTTPGPTLKPVLSDVKETEVTVRWSPPASDHGAPVIGYKVMIMLEGYSGADWYTLCEQTKSSNPVYIVTNLKGNKKYLMDIRAINKVGVGDESVFEIATAPVPPDAPSKPWIEEVREGCLCVAWTPPAEDGGAQITAYKVKMRKILGATRYGFWSGAPSWVDMGTVGAAMNQHVVDQPAVYTAWVGPLEQATCEYRFQVVALNRAGVSDASQLSDAHYT
mmetsp:Transcript_65349/g.156229  ORF Transcript_65349/g.156229 Transcript_65349/m.156229 type:complete len:821 (-) Transcript_65349:26-2488(-)